MVAKKIKSIFMVGGKIDKSFTRTTKVVGSNIKAVSKEIGTAKKEQDRLLKKIAEARRNGEDISGLRRKYEKLGDTIGDLENRHSRLNRRQEKFGKFEGLIKGAGKVAAGFGVVGLAIGAVEGLVFGLTDSVSDNLDVIDKWSKKLGLTQQAFQEFRGAAGLAGVGDKQFDVGLQRFARRMAQFRDLGSGEAAFAFEELGFERAELHGKNLEQIFTMVAERMSTIRDEQTKIRIAQKLFDSEGVDMVNMFTGGAAGLAEMRKQFRETGFVFDEHATGKAVKYRDSLLLLRASMKGVVSELGISVMPTLTNAIEEATVWIKTNRREITGWIEQFADLHNGTMPDMVKDLKLAADAALILAGAVVKVGNAFGWLNELGKGIGNSLGFLEYMADDPVVAMKDRMIIAERARKARERRAKEQAQKPAVREPKVKTPAIPLSKPMKHIVEVVNGDSGAKIKPVKDALASQVVNSKSEKKHSVNFGDIKINVTAKEGQSPRELSEEIGKEFKSVVADMSDREALYDLEADAV